MPHRLRSLTLIYYSNALFSIGNFFLTVAIARAVSVGEFGFFALAGAMQFALVGLFRSSWTENQILTKSYGLGGSHTLLVVLTSLAAIPAGVGVLSSNGFMVATALSVPALCLVERARLITMTFSRESYFAVVQTITAGTTAGAALATELDLLSALTGYWTAQLFLVAVVAMSILLYRGPGRTERDDGGYSVWYGLDFLTGSGLVQLTTLFLPLVGGTAAVAALRGAGTLYAPGQILVTSLRPVLLSEASVDSERSTSLALDALRSTRPWIAPMALLVVIVCLLPQNFGSALLGETWTVVQGFRLPVGLEVAISVIGVGIFAKIRQHLPARRVVLFRGILGISRLSVVLIVTALWGFSIAVWALPIGSAVMSTVWLYVLHLHGSSKER